MKRSLFVMLLSIFLSACSETEVFNFVDQSDNWKVTYTVEILDNQIEQTKTIIEYIGEKSIPEQINYSIEWCNGNRRA
ncbi:hypothetical protein [Oceanobacillus senegalensis]|uniref:hypothetical protein n=1 Tax=Oceanobacillus senegalensis TaxID=1936063 RepID=UPI000A306FC5|nr:hypothetical protein [Oceanobacillus senegalensis]